MSLNKQSGNMYPFVTHTWNPIKGKCSHDCVYCFMKRFPQNPIRLDEKDLKTDLGEGSFIFVGSSTDMWADDVPHDWIVSVMQHCEQYPKNRYLFQSKNPWGFPSAPYAIESILGTTIETNRKYKQLGKAPKVSDRARGLYHSRCGGFRTMVTIEPVMDFDVDAMSELVELCCPEWVNIGADSKGHELPEPPAEKVRALIEKLNKFTEVKVKSNLARILKEEDDE